MCLEKGTELKKDLEHQDLEGDGRAESGGKEAQAGPSHSPHWRVQPGKGQALIPGDRIRGNSLKLCYWRFGLDIRRTFSTEGDTKHWN